MDAIIDKIELLIKDIKSLEQYKLNNPSLSTEQKTAVDQIIRELQIQMGTEAISVCRVPHLWLPYNPRWRNGGYRAIYVKYPVDTFKVTVFSVFLSEL
jgi:hypothetical protein